MGAAVEVSQADSTKPVGGSFMHKLFTIPLVVQGGVLSAIGFPLWVSGAEEVSDNDRLAEATTSEPIPEVHLGAGSVTLSLRF